MLQELLESDPKLRRQSEQFWAEMEFKKKLIELRKSEAMTQKQVAEKSGLTQQAVSRLEKESGTMLGTLLCYLKAMGYTLGLQKNS